jgi:hypothetical protein
MTVFDHDDDAYLAWVASNPDGYVVNCERKPNHKSTRLHLSSCATITTPMRTNYRP